MLIYEFQAVVCVNGLVLGQNRTDLDLGKVVNKDVRYVAFLSVAEMTNARLSWVVV
jgi:hypothetical protein